MSISSSSASKHAWNVAFFNATEGIFGSEIAATWERVVEFTGEIARAGGDIIDVAPVTPVSFDGPVRHKEGLVSFG